MNQAQDNLTFSITGSIGHMVLNQPPGNRMTAGFFSEFNALVDSIKGLNGLEALVISSSGRHFSSGADLDELLGNPEEFAEGNFKALKGNWEEIFEKNFHSFLFFEDADIPVISAIRGVCIGSAFELALFSHFRFCGEDAVFGLPETTFNLMPGLGGTRKLAALCGEAKAIELVLRGNTFDASEAHHLHLVDRIIPRRKVVDFSFAFARKVMKNYKKQKAPLYLQQIPMNESFVS